MASARAFRCSAQSLIASANRPRARRARCSTPRSTYIERAFSLLSFLAIRWRKPARDFEFTSHHRRIIAIHGKVDRFKDNKRVGLLNIVKKMDEVRPMTARFDGSKNSLMRGSRFA